MRNTLTLKSALHSNILWDFFSAMAERFRLHTSSLLIIRAESEGARISTASKKLAAVAEHVRVYFGRFTNKNN